MKDLLAGIVILCLWFLVATAVPAATYSVTDLGVLTDLPNRSDSRPNAISNNGKVAAANVIGGTYRALLYDGSWTNLGTLGGNESIGAGVNDSGVAVGSSKLADGSTRGFVWTSGATDGVPGNPQMEALGTLGGAISEAYSINASGQITGYAQTSAADHAFRYNNGTMTDIGELLGSNLPNSYGYGINAAGHVAGTAYKSNFSRRQAFFYDGVTASDIGNLGGGDASALAINNNDQIAGYSTDPGGFYHAFRYAGGVMTDLGTLGGDYSYALAINNSNVIVGGSFIDAGNSVYHAFICETNSMSDLNTQLDSSGTGWTLVEARAINDSGQVVGVGSIGGVYHGFLLRPVVASPPVPIITAIRIVGTNVLISFTTVPAASYAVETRSNLTETAWNAMPNSLSGTGSAVTATNAVNPDSPAQYYRVKVSTP